MFTTGRICLKTAGRDAGKYCVVLKATENGYVLIDGETRRKRVNVNHLEPTKKTVKVKEEAETQEVKDALKKEGIAVKERGQPKQPAQRPVKQKTNKQKKTAE
ncbi:MAG: 50S ribosomal protein L14e [Candidatus Nanoarchaeia archaeon]